MRKKEYETSQCSTCGVHDAVGSAGGRICGGAGGGRTGKWRECAGRDGTIPLECGETVNDKL